MLKKVIFYFLLSILLLMVILGVTVYRGIVNNPFNTEATVDNPLNENEIISYVEQEVFKETGDTVIAKIISKNNLTGGGAVWNYYAIDGAHSYNLEITNKDNSEIVATGYYSDGYITNGGTKFESYFTNNYTKQKGLFLVKNEFIDALNQKFDKYYIYKDVSNEYGYDIFINSSNYDDINDLLLSFKDIVIKHKNYEHIGYSVYIYKDEDIFNNTNFELYNNGTDPHGGQSYGKDMIEQYTGKEVTRIGFAEEFDYDLFKSNGASAAETYDEYVDYNTFEYLVFWYSASPNSFVGYNKPKLQIFGVK